VALEHGPFTVKSRFFYGGLSFVFVVFRLFHSFKTCVDRNFIEILKCFITNRVKSGIIDTLWIKS